MLFRSLNHIDINACSNENIHVISLKGETEFLKNITSTAELTFGLILELIRHIGESSRYLTFEHKLDRDRFRGYQLSGKSIKYRLSNIVKLLIAS